MQVTQKDIENYSSGEWWNIADDTLDYMIQLEHDKTLNLFNCTAFQATNENGYTLIYHTCSKSNGYQLSYFDSNMMPISDIYADSKDELTQKSIDTFNLLNNYTMQEVIQ